MREGEGGRRREGRQREQGGEQGCFDHKTFGCMKLLCISLVPKLLPMQPLSYCDKSWEGAWEQVQLYTVLTEDIYTKKKGTHLDYDSFLCIIKYSSVESHYNECCAEE